MRKKEFILLNGGGTIMVKENSTNKIGTLIKGGVIMDVTNIKEALMAERAGAKAIMVLERVPADIIKDGGIARMSDPKLIKEIKQNSNIPVMAKVRIGHFVEAQILEALAVDWIDESEVLTTADNFNHIDKHSFKTPFVCGARNLGEALRRIAEGAKMIRTKGQAGTGNIAEAVYHMRTINSEIAELKNSPQSKLVEYAKNLAVPLELVKWVHENGKLPVLNLAAGGVATPADAALMMQLGAEGIFVGSGIFKSGNPEKRAKAIVDAVKHYNNPEKLAEISEDLGEAMSGVSNK
jgi:pyridoxal 5'-phosphate synthase pdxS subunit